MEIIFSKISESRKKEYEIVTTLTLLDGKKYICKKGVFTDAHIKNMNDNIKLLRKYFGDYVDDSYIKDDTLFVPYAEGETLSKLIAKGDVEKAIDLYEQILSKIPTKKFSKFENAENKFYDIDFDDDEESFIVTNYDLVFSNVIYDGKNLKIIDNEWVFAYPIPKKAVIYRAFKLIKQECPYLDIDLKKYFEKYEITDFKKYDKLEEQFQRHVVSDFKYREKYAKKEIFFDSTLDYSSLKRDLDNALNEIQELKPALQENVKKNEDLTKEKDLYKAKAEEYESSTAFKLFKPLWKFRDWLFPKGTKRYLFAKLIKNAIRHPIWTLKHLNGHNLRKFKIYLKSESPDRCLERIETYKTNNPTSEEFNFEKFDMSPRKEYPVLEFKKVEKPLVSIIIPVYNQFSYTYGCLESILANTNDVDYEVIIGDDCSTDETSHLEDFAKNIIVVHNEENLRFLLNCNHAAEVAKGQYIFFLNNDTNVQKNWLSSLLETINSDPRIGMVGSKLIYPDGRLQEAGGILWRDGSAWNFGSKGDPTASEYNYRKPVDYISGAAIMIKKSLWDEIGGFDKTFVPSYCEDSDLAFEVRNHGYEVIYDPFSVVIHYEGVSNGTDTSTGLKKYQVINSEKFYEKWKDVLVEHPENAVDVFKARERCYRKKTILVIDHYVPEFDKDAGSKTMFDYLNIFVELGYNVKFMGENFYHSEPYTSILQRKGIEVLYGPYYANNWKMWLKNNGPYFDYVFLSRPHITAKFLDSVKKSCTNAKFIYYGHDLHFLRMYREYEISKDKNVLTESNKWKETELDIFDKVDLIYYPSVIEQDEVKKINEKYNVKVLQPYVYKSIISDYDPKLRNNLLFVGGFRHGANFDGINWFIKEIFPKILEKDSEMVLTIAGSFPPQELLDMNSKNIQVLGYVSNEKLEELYHEAKMVVAPLRFGAGIKGKIIEAMQHGLPVITTDVGAEGIDNKAIFVTNTFDELLDLYNDDERLTEYSKLETKFIKENYSYESACSNLLNDFNELDK